MTSGLDENEQVDEILSLKYELVGLKDQLADTQAALAAATSTATLERTASGSVATGGQKATKVLARALEEHEKELNRVRAELSDAKTELARTTAAHAQAKSLPHGLTMHIDAIESGEEPAPRMEMEGGGSTPGAVARAARASKLALGMEGELKQL